MTLRTFANWMELSGKAVADWKATSECLRRHGFRFSDWDTLEVTESTFKKVTLLVPTRTSPVAERNTFARWCAMGGYEVSSWTEVGKALSARGYKFSDWDRTFVTKAAYDRVAMLASLRRLSWKSMREDKQVAEAEAELKSHQVLEHELEKAESDLFSRKAKVLAEEREELEQERKFDRKERSLARRKQQRERAAAEDAALDQTLTSETAKGHLSTSYYIDAELAISRRRQARVQESAADAVEEIEVSVAHDALRARERATRAEERRVDQRIAQTESMLASERQAERAAAAKIATAKAASHRARTRRHYHAHPTPSAIHYRSAARSTRYTGPAPFVPPSARRAGADAPAGVSSANCTKAASGKHLFRRSTMEPLERMQQAKQMLEAGLITQLDYEAAKRKALGLGRRPSATALTA